MKNIDMSVSEDKILTIRVDLKEHFGQSKTGKSVIVASTEGNQAIPGTEAKIGLNIYETRS